ncbi:MAG: 16S rRNA (adenine(1518)-N(6)/adenine(1519)-N(6))-dimethyltransferase RsmA [Rudaea sp.]|uniref:16S rRNA (adenine(1518)-N(6)/adenine(1519)-N(6))- dimethyltransferase RsmA n=1 Tax=unclassified Rudaea TaxID=2627037 RepID=UPI0010F4A049|nr:MULTISPECIES: 16S rRNA (adenine(1518)-N(6)/adenine(1519)-N(6))-dimethyltransferase RsmA [unclassified Rudaea]MBN8886328.1 16S rRNA (adenine(1518)-N(6)/adenine(1519)-N(6))-dimethyltransferase RsmA [Rudaea sp.]
MNDFAPHVTKKRFGQHFLHDKNILRRIVEYVAAKPGECLVEIGPGEGALTFLLLQATGRLTAIELDRDLIEPLRARAKGVGELTIVNRDVLEVDFSALARDAGVSKVRLVGNLPYNISTPILFHCLDHAGVIDDMHFMLQKEVVERMAAGPGSKTYGRLSVMLQLRCSVEPLFDVPPTAFSPPPKVDSAVVRLVPLPAEKLPQTDFVAIDRVVRAAFGQRRKTLGNALRQVAGADDLAAAGIDARERAEQLPPAAFVALARVLESKN